MNASLVAPSEVHAGQIRELRQSRGSQIRVPQPALDSHHVEGIPGLLIKRIDFSKTGSNSSLLLAADLQQRIAPTVRIRRGLTCFRVTDPAAVYDEEIFVATRRQVQIAGPRAVTRAHHRRGFEIPVVERADQPNLVGMSSRHFEMNR